MIGNAERHLLQRVPLCLSKKPRRVRARRRESSTNLVSPVTCASGKTLLRLQVWGLSACGGPIPRAAGCCFLKKSGKAAFSTVSGKGPLALFLFVPARVLEEFFGKSKSGSPWSGEGHPAAEPRKECVWEESPGDCPCKRERRTRWALRGADCRTGSPSCSAWPGMHRPSCLPSHDTCPSAPNMPRYKSFSQNIIDI